jgi:hypothetical protein
MPPTAPKTPQIIYLYRRMVAEPDPLKQFALDQSSATCSASLSGSALLSVIPFAMKMMNHPLMMNFEIRNGAKPVSYGAD